MHSSRMLTARLLPISPNMHFSGGYLVLEGVPRPRGCTYGGTWFRGCVYLPRGVPGPGGVPGPEGCTGGQNS